MARFSVQLQIKSVKITQYMWKILTIFTLFYNQIIVNIFIAFFVYRYNWSQTILTFIFISKFNILTEHSRSPSITLRTTKFAKITGSAKCEIFYFTNSMNSNMRYTHVSFCIFQILLSVCIFAIRPSC